MCFKQGAQNLGEKHPGLPDLPKNPHRPLIPNSQEGKATSGVRG